MDKNIRRIEIRRGLSSQRISVLYEEGEPVYIIDKKRLYIGDNQTLGGNLATNINFVQDDTNIPINSEETDLLLDKSDTNGYLINRDNSLTKIFSTCCEGVQEFIDRANNFFDGLSSEFCPYTLNEDLCKYPIFNKKYLNFGENLIYKLDIFNPLKTQFINFKDNLGDSDSNVPFKNIYIKKDSIKTSPNLKLLDNDISTITVKTNNLQNNVSENAWVIYGLENSCGKTTTGMVSGFIDPKSIRRFFFDYDYLLLSTEFYDGTDLDLYVNIINPKIQSKDVFFNNKNFSDIVKHGGNNIGTNTEYVLIDLKKFKEIYPNVNNLTLDIKCMWNTKSSNKPIYLNLDLYKGGTYLENVNKNGFDIINYTKTLNIRDFNKVMPTLKNISRYCTLNVDIKEYITVLNSNDTVILN